MIIFVQSICVWSLLCEWSIQKYVITIVVFGDFICGHIKFISKRRELMFTWAIVLFKRFSCILNEESRNFLHICDSSFYVNFTFTLLSTLLPCLRVLRPYQGHWKFRKFFKEKKRRKRVHAPFSFALFLRMDI